MLQVRSHHRVSCKHNVPEIIMTLDQVSWQYICKHYPVFAQNFMQEYQRCNGFIPYEPGFVYVIHAVGSNYYKIGKSVNPDRRLLQIAPQMPFRTRFVRVWHSYFMSMAENMLHVGHEHCRANGEWFEFNDKYDLTLLLTKWNQRCVKYAYVSKIHRLLWANREEAKRYEEEFGYAPFEADLTGSHAIAQVETLFNCCQESLDPGLPEDLKLVIDGVLEEWSRPSSGSNEG